MTRELTPPVYSFDHLSPVTMTVIVTCDIKEMNLDALFSFLPVTTEYISTPMSAKKQGKIRLPSYLNTEGRILSMRYRNNVRGIVRSETATGFPNSIILDVGTSERIISTKLSQTLGVVGVKSNALAREAAENILNTIRQCQDDLDFVQANMTTAIKVKQAFIQHKVGLKKSECPTDKVEKRLWSIFEDKTVGQTPDQKEPFLDFLLKFDQRLCTGSLGIISDECVMANIPFHLGFAINLMEFTKVLNHPPFECKFNTFRSASAVTVRYYYSKYDRIMKRDKTARFTIEVYRSGYVRFSGPGVMLMRIVYREFMKRLLPNMNRVVSASHVDRIVRVPSTQPCRVLTRREYENEMNKQAARYNDMVYSINDTSSIPPVKRRHGTLRLNKKQYSFCAD